MQHCVEYSRASLLSPTLLVFCSCILTLPDRVHAEQQRVMSHIKRHVADFFEDLLQASLQLMHAECAVLKGMVDLN